jgi:acyl-CoA thioesterase
MLGVLLLLAATTGSAQQAVQGRVVNAETLAPIPGVLDLPFGKGAVIMASLDHALWFHRTVQIDDWLLYSMDSPNASGARGLGRGQFFNRHGELIASTTQEGLVRVVTGTAGKRSNPRLQN